MSKIIDNEFGEITVRRNPRSGGIKISVAPNGTLRVSSSKYTPLVFIRKSINSSRTSIRKLIANSHTDNIYEHGQRIGKEHLLLVKASSKLAVVRDGSVIVVHLPDERTIAERPIQQMIRQEAIKALRKEANRHLPKRLEHQASRMSCSYDKLRFSHASTRWGSCSSGGTISLNIALMKLPYELIDYVIIHELSHTIHLNHSKDFWELVTTFDPDFKKHRTEIRKYQPSI